MMCCSLPTLFLRQFAAKYGKDVHEISPRARALLLSYPWPGNVRELSHVIERAVLWSRGAILDPDHLSLTEPAAFETPGTSPGTHGTPAVTPIPIRTEGPRTRGLESRLAEATCRSGRRPSSNRHSAKQAAIRPRPPNASASAATPSAIG